MRYIIIISLLLIISTVSAVNKECFQESADNFTITDTMNCGLKYTGSYGGDENISQNIWADNGVNSGTGHEINITGWHDSNYLTFSVIVDNIPVYVNYSIPNNTVSAKWSLTVPAGVIIEFNSSTGNFSIPSSCLNNIFSNILQIKITNDNGWNSGIGLFHVNCWNYASSDWYEFWIQGTPNVWLFEESMWWNVSSEPIIFQPFDNPPEQNQNISETNSTLSPGITKGTKDLLDITVGLLSLAIVLSAGLWVYKLTRDEEMTVKKMIVVFAYLTIGLVLLQIIASVINKL